MSLSPISFIAPNYRDYKNHWIKPYEPGTTTPKLFSLESNGGTQVVKLEINKDGFLISAGEALVIPYVNGSYDIWMFPSEAEADANDTSNALRIADDIDTVEGQLTGDLSQAYEFPTVAAYKAFVTAFPVGKVVNLLDRGASYTVIDGTGTANTYNIINSDQVPQSIDLTLNNELPTLTQLGLASNPTDNSAIMQFAVDTFGGYLVDADYEFNVALSLPSTGAKIINKGIRREALWSGPDGDYAIFYIDENGSYINVFEGWTLRASTQLKHLMDARFVRFSRFDGFYMLDGLVQCRHNSAWNNAWFKCRFWGKNKSANSNGLLFEFDNTLSFNSNNTTVFESCLFAFNVLGIVLESGGSGLSFNNCGMEANDTNLVIRGGGNANEISFKDNYWELGTNANILWNKTGSGNFYNIIFDGNYWGTESTARAGIIEFIGDNGSNHSIVIKNSSFKSFNGAPSTGLLLDVNGATMSNIFIDWYDNNFITETGITIFPFDKNDVDWRYLNTDVGCPLDLEPPGARTWTMEENLIVMVENGTATLTGVFDSVDNAFSGALNVTQAMPVTIRPANFTQQLCTSITDSSSEATAVTCMINGGQLRTIGITTETVRVDMTWRIATHQRSTDEEI